MPADASLLPKLAHPGMRQPLRSANQHKTGPRATAMRELHTIARSPRLLYCSISLLDNETSRRANSPDWKAGTTGLSVSRRLGTQRAAGDITGVLIFKKLNFPNRGQLLP